MVKGLLAFCLLAFLPLSATAQDVIVNPDISYAGTPRQCEIGGITVKGVEGYEDYVAQSAEKVSADVGRMSAAEWEKLCDESTEEMTVHGEDIPEKSSTTLGSSAGGVPSENAPAAENFAAAPVHVYVPPAAGKTDRPHAIARPSLARRPHRACFSTLSDLISYMSTLFLFTFVKMRFLPRPRALKAFRVEKRASV